MRTKSLYFVIGITLLASIIFFTFLKTSLSVQAENQHWQQETPFSPNDSLAKTTAASMSFLVNQPWDWIEGNAEAEQALTALLRRDGQQIAAKDLTSDASGEFSFEFRDANSHIDILAGDEVEIQDGTSSTTVTVVAITGGTDVDTDSIIGTVSHGIFPASGLVNIGYPSNLGFVTETVAFGENGNFVVALGDKIDINHDHVAKIVYTDPQSGNRVSQIFYPEGLDVRAFITEDKIEGVTTPGTTIRILVSDASGAKGVATTTADEAGFYSTFVYEGERKIDLELGDHVTVSKPGTVHEMDLTMYHVSYVQPWNNRVVGIIKGIEIPTAGTHGRVDIWSTSDQQWHTQYTGIDQQGNYGVDFDGIVEMTAADVIRVWATLPDGTQQVALGWAMELGSSPTDDFVWGHTTVSSTATITLYRGLEAQSPVDVLGTATAVVDRRGYFSATVMSEDAIVDIMPSNIVVVQAGEHIGTLFVGEVEAFADPTNDWMHIKGPSNATIHLEGRRPGVLRKDAPYQEEYIWRKVELDANGEAMVNLATFDVQKGDWFDFTCYNTEAGQSIHYAMAIPTQTLSLNTLFTPLIMANTD